MNSNIFEVLGLINVEELNSKTNLAIILLKSIKSQPIAFTGWTQAEVSSLMNAELDDISIEQLLNAIKEMNESTN